MPWEISVWVSAFFKLRPFESYLHYVAALIILLTSIVAIAVQKR